MGTAGREDLLPAALQLVDQILPFVCRAHDLDAEESESLASLVSRKLLDHHCAVLRSFRGESTLKTFLCVVIQHAYLDFRTIRWGKWRPSAAARRAGPFAVELDRLIRRDGMATDEAVERVLAGRTGCASREELLAIAARLPCAPTGGRPRAFAEPADACGDGGQGSVDRQELSARVLAILRSALGRLDAEDRWVLMSHFRDGLAVAKIARALDQPPKALRTRILHALRRLRACLEREGFRASDLGDVIGRADVQLDLWSDHEEEEKGKIVPMRPSKKSVGE